MMTSRQELPKHRPHLFLSKLGRLIFFLRYKIYNVCWCQIIKVGFFFTHFSFLKCTFYSFVFHLIIFFSETKDFIQLGTIKFTTDTPLLTLPVFVLMCSYYQICVIWNHISIFLLEKSVKIRRFSMILAPIKSYLQSLVSRWPYCTITANTLFF